MSGLSVRSVETGVKPTLNVKPEAPTFVSDTLTLTCGALKVVVGVVVESAKSVEVCVMDICGCEIPTKTFGQGEMVMGVVVEAGDGGVKY